MISIGTKKSLKNLTTVNSGRVKLLLLFSLCSQYGQVQPLPQDAQAGLWVRLSFCGRERTNAQGQCSLMYGHGAA